MKATKKMTALKSALALAAVLAMSGTAAAKKPSNSGLSGDLSSDRTSATITVTQQCDPVTQGASGALSVYIFQSVGRLINIGIGSGTVLCNNSTTAQDVVVNAIPGLTFQPGPATLLVRFTTVDPLTLQPTVSESGFTINLHP